MIAIPEYALTIKIAATQTKSACADYKKSKVFKTCVGRFCLYRRDFNRSLQDVKSTMIDAEILFSDKLASKRVLIFQSYARPN
ncbi:MAG TPA: hypothetical protein DCY88_01885 [Cyanobacteria bacterium UBA11372]|nr:hypothetical protein [Cyanobacteria bacterium UBA11372]